MEEFQELYCSSMDVFLFYHSSNIYKLIDIYVFQRARERVPYLIIL